MNQDEPAPVISGEQARIHGNGYKNEPEVEKAMEQQVAHGSVDELEPPGGDTHAEIDFSAKPVNNVAPPPTAPSQGIEEDDPSKQPQPDQTNHISPSPLLSAPTSDHGPSDSYGNTYEDDYPDDGIGDAVELVPKDLSSLPYLQALHFPKKDLPLNCVISGCGRSLSHQPEYYQRYRICKEHLLCPMINVGTEGPHRFCQQCGKFQHISLFDGNKRNCRARLRKHNDRRRQQKMLMDDLERRNRKNRGANPSLGRRFNSAPGGSTDPTTGLAEKRGAYHPVDNSTTTSTWKQQPSDLMWRNGGNGGDDEDDEYNPYRRERPRRSKARRRSYAAFDNAGYDDEEVIKQAFEYAEQDVVEYEQKPNNRHNRRVNGRFSAYRPPASAGRGGGGGEEDEGDVDVEDGDYESRLVDMLVDLQDPSLRRKRAAPGGGRRRRGEYGEDGDGQPPLPPPLPPQHYQQYDYPGGPGRYSSDPLPRMGGVLKLAEAEKIDKNVTAEIQELAHLISALSNRTNSVSDQHQQNSALPPHNNNNNGFFPSAASNPKDTVLSELEMALARFSSAAAAAAAGGTINNNPSHHNPSQLPNLSFADAVALPKSVRQKILADLLDQQHDLQCQIYILREADRMMNPLNATAHGGTGTAGGGMMSATVPRNWVAAGNVGMPMDEGIAMYEQQHLEQGAGGGGGGGGEQQQQIPDSVLQGAAHGGDGDGAVKSEQQLENPFSMQMQQQQQQQNTAAGEINVESNDANLTTAAVSDKNDNNVNDDGESPPGQQKSATTVMDPPFASDPPGEAVLPSEQEQQLMTLLLNQLFKAQGTM